MRSVGRRVFHIITDVKQQSAGTVLTEKATVLAMFLRKTRLSLQVLKLTPLMIFKRTEVTTIFILLTIFFMS